MTNQKNYYITTPIYYLSGDPHIGAMYTSLSCDVLARFKRLDGYNVKFLTGTDEHGLKVAQVAEKKGMTPIEHCDENSQLFRDLTPLCKFSNDDFIRTTEERHIKGAQAFWTKLMESGYIYKGSYSGWYAVRDEAYYDESELKDGPNGSKLAPTGAPVEWMEEESYFFKLSAWGDKLIEYYTANPHACMPQARLNEVLGFIKGGLNDVSISRTNFDWGVPVPGDDKHVMYVWIDALSNYLTALGYPDESGDMATFWPADVHMVGKDILRFHAVYWPAFLMAAGLEPPKRVFAHGWWVSEGEKMSKSLGNVIDPKTVIEKYGLDQVRYFLMREMTFGNDGNFSHDGMIKRMNTELANDFGNLAQRSLSMIFKNCDAAIPEPGEFSVADEKMLNMAGEALLQTVRSEFDQQAFHKVLDAIWDVIRAANAYVDEQAPWALKKTDPARMGTVLYVLAEVVRNTAMLTAPFMPDSSGKMLDQLKVGEGERDLGFIGKSGLLKAGTPIDQPQGVFPRFVEQE